MRVDVDHVTSGFFTQANDKIACLFPCFTQRSTSVTLLKTTSISQADNCATYESLQEDRSLVSREEFKCDYVSSVFRFDIGSADVMTLC